VAPLAEQRQPEEVEGPDGPEGAEAPADPPAGTVDLRTDRSFLRDVQYGTDANLAARQSIYAYQHPRIDLTARVLDLAAPARGEVVADVGCGNGAYLCELARRGFAGRVIGADLSFGMLRAARAALRQARGMAAPDEADATAEASSAVPPRGATALAGADVAALPLRDGCADLTLAMHMLYHVPDRAAAVRELRRVTRPGGRVVVGLNGSDSLKELWALIDAAGGGDLRPYGERLRLDEGEALLRTVFSSVTRHDFTAELRIPGPEPVAAYVRSMSSVQASADPENLVAAVLSRLPNDPGCLFRITTHAGCLVCM
jgi:SAM-dependent methyltransferase